MANAFYTADEAAVVAAKLANEETTLASMVSRNYVDEFLGTGTGGKPVGIPIPTTLIARDRAVDDITSSIVFDEIAETRQTLNLDRVLDYSAVPLSEQDINLDLQDFTTQVLKPQSKAIVDKMEQKVADKLLGVPVSQLVDVESPDGGTTPTTYHTYDPADPVPYFTQIRKTLRKNGVSVDGIQLVVGAEVFANLLDANALTDVSASGSTAALRDAQVGKVRGMLVVENLRVPDAEILAFHRDAVTLVTRAPAVSPGASFGAVVNEGGFSLRYLRDYLVDQTVDRSFVSTFSGVAILPTFKIERDYSTGTVSTTEIPNGGILHLDTAA